MRQFLVVYRRSVGRLLACEDLGTDRAAALAQRFERERREKDDPDIEVILFSAPSEAALMRTHARYFRTEEQLRNDLRASSSN